ncbi:DUF4199 domain-containing protein [Sinomicrobium sp.]
MIENTTPTGKFALNYGLLLGGISVVFSLILFSMDLHYQGGSSVFIVSVLSMLGCIIAGLIQYRKVNGGYMTFSQGLKIGVGICLIGGVITMLFQFVLSNVLDPEMTAKQLDIARAQMQEQGLGADEIEARIEMAKKFTGPFIQAAFGLIGSVFFGFVLSIIPVLVLKKSNPEYS